MVALFGLQFHPLGEDTPLQAVTPPSGTGFVHDRYAKTDVPVKNVRFGFKPQGKAGP